VFALRVVKELDVVEHVLAGFFAGFVFLAADALALKQVEETLDGGSCWERGCAVQETRATLSW
jgi:hypothetical protein